MFKFKRFKGLVGAVCLLSLAIPSFAKKPADEEYDAFAEMAEESARLSEKSADWSGGKIEILQRDLTWDEKIGEGFKPSDKIDTQEELDAELARMRKKFAPFMAELAPALPETRQRIELKTFQWKVTSMTDKHDKSAVMDGKWREVTIPHYGGPMNKASTLYRKEIDFAANLLKADTLFIHFQAADYVAEVFVNGKEVGRHEGLFGSFEFDIKPIVKPGKNVIEVKLHNDIKMCGDTHANLPPWKIGHKLAGFGGPGWDQPGNRKGTSCGEYAMGWHCSGAGMGLWQKCWLEARPAAYVNDIYVRPLPDTEQVEVWLEVGDSAKSTEIFYSLYGQNFKQTLAENKKADVTFAPAKDGIRFCKFTIPVPKFRWWNHDTPWLYQVQIQVKQDGKLVDAAKRHFGMRTFTQSFTSKPKGKFYFNGKEIKLRGANMMGNLMQCVMRNDLDQLRDDILLAKISNMNFWRMTQQPCQEIVYDYFDKLGLLAQTDLPAFGGITRARTRETTAQFVEMMRLVRRHPCNSVLSYINEPSKAGHKKYNRAYLNPGELTTLFRNFDKIKEELCPGQAAKWTDGDIYHVIWRNYIDHHAYDTWYSKGSFKSIYYGKWPRAQGWMSAAGEFGGEALDSIELMKKYYPEEWVKTGPNGEWSPGKIPLCQQVKVGRAWYGPKTMKQWVDNSRALQRWGTRMRTEANRRIPWMNSYAIHLLIDAWPAGWLKSIMDCDRQAKPAFFEYIDVNTPMAVNLQFHGPVRFYQNAGGTIHARAWVCNDTHDVPEAVLRYQVELGGKVIQTGSAPAIIKPMYPQSQGSMKIKVPHVKKRQFMMVRLGLFDKSGKLIHDTVWPLDVIPKGHRAHSPGGFPQSIVR